MSICILDTSVFCNILNIPGRNQHHAVAKHDLEVFIREDWTLLLPMATVLETGNHIGQLANGHARRSSAGSFCEAVLGAIEGKAPWTATPLPDQSALAEWLERFPDASSRGLGLGDLSIVHEWDVQRLRFPTRRIRVWTYDGHLLPYDTQ